MKNEGGGEGHSNWTSTWDCGDRGLLYFKFEHVVFLKNSLYPFPLVTAKLIGDVLSFFYHFTPSSALPIQDVNIHKANCICGTIIYFLKRQDGSNLQDEYSNNWEFADCLEGSPSISYLKRDLDAPLYWRNILSPLCLFVMTWPIN